MPAATLAEAPSVIAASPVTSATPACHMPGALQQFLDRIEEQRNMNLRTSQDLYRLKSDAESRWRIASSEGHTSSTMLYEILEYGWKEWQRLGNR